MIFAFVLAVAIIGPLFSPHGPADIVGAPGQSPSSSALFGTDFLGRDVLSRVLWGGRGVLVVAVAATVLAFLVGTFVGLVAGVNRNLLDPLLMRTVDLILAFPPLLFFILVATSVGTGEFVLIVGVALVQVPGVARIVYSATRESAVRAYVEAAVARGERPAAIVWREIVPSVASPVIANFGLSLTYAVLMVAAVNFLGLGQQPPAANWALMISENRVILSQNVWSTIAPAAMIALLTIGVNLLADAVSQSRGRSEFEEVVIGSGLSDNVAEELLG